MTKHTTGNSLPVLPADLQLGEKIGHGARSDVYSAELAGEEIAVKVYHADAIDKYRRRYGVSIAQFEYERNLAFYNVPRLRAYVARPIRAFGSEDGCCEGFAQQLVRGQRLRELARETGYVPAATVAILRDIIEAATAEGLYDIDLCAKNILVRVEQDVWYPILFDFNLMPQYLHAPNPWVAFLYWAGIRKRSFRDYRHLRNLEDWKGARARGAV